MARRLASKIGENAACSVARDVPISAQKMRLVADLVRGQKATDAIALLRYTPKAAAEPISKAIASAVANAVENKQMNAEDLVVSQILIDGAPLRQWRRFAARGRFRPIIRRSSHVSIVVSEKEEE